MQTPTAGLTQHPIITDEPHTWSTSQKTICSHLFLPTLKMVASRTAARDLYFLTAEGVLLRPAEGKRMYHIWSEI